MLIGVVKLFLRKSLNKRFITDVIKSIIDIWNEMLHRLIIDAQI